MSQLWKGKLYIERSILRGRKWWKSPPTTRERVTGQRIVSPGDIRNA
jgi:hypothetical protein